MIWNFRCKTCFRSFLQRDDLSKHRQKIHKIFSDPSDEDDEENIKSIRVEKVQGFIKVTDYQAKLLKLKGFDIVLPRIKSKSGKNKIKTVKKVDKNDSFTKSSADPLLHECEKCDYKHLGKWLGNM